MRGFSNLYKRNRGVGLENIIFFFERPVMEELYASVWLIKDKNKATTEELAVFYERWPGFSTQKLRNRRSFNW